MGARDVRDMLDVGGETREGLVARLARSERRSSSLGLVSSTYVSSNVVRVDHYNLRTSRMRSLMRTECLLYWKDCCVVCLSIKYSKYLHSVLFGRPPPRSLTDPSPPVPPCSPCFSSLLHLLALFPTDLHPLVYSLFVQASYSRRG